MSEQEAAYSPEFQRFQELVETALVQAAADARELAERTGTKLVIRERPMSDIASKGDAGEHKGLESAMLAGKATKRRARLDKNITRMQYYKAGRKCEQHPLPWGNPPVVELLQVSDPGMEPLPPGSEMFSG
ncbi:MAG: hypothetical protein LBH94_00845 [Deltaproteobacteria bacterium]|jgi:hypothetical protein|nr:hypothetical protein [Deltaproteobacteria bacterium]